MRSVILAAGLLMATALPALAGPRDDVLYGISRCGGISDDRTWLNCVYGAAQPMRAQLGLPPAPVAQTALVPPPMPGTPAPAMAASQPGMVAAVPAASRRKPSFWSKLWEEGHDPVVSAVMMTDYRFDKKGNFTVTLANGQVWAQDPKEHHHAGWTGTPAQYVVTITPDDSNVFHLHAAGDENDFTVRRVS